MYGTFPRRTRVVVNEREASVRLSLALSWHQMTTDLENVVQGFITVIIQIYCRKALVELALASRHLLPWRLLLNILETTPTPNENGSYGVKAGFRMPRKLESVCRQFKKVGSCIAFSVKSPFISRDFHAIRPLISWHISGAYFLLIGGGGVCQNCFRLDRADNWNRSGRAPVLICPTGQKAPSRACQHPDRCLVSHLCATVGRLLSYHLLGPKCSTAQHITSCNDSSTCSNNPLQTPNACLHQNFSAPNRAI